ncbi:hypothetical protein ACVI1J_010073 [Bradyrhizobium diazoefficiens]|jgi:hypothetical protein
MARTSMWAMSAKLGQGSPRQPRVPILGGSSTERMIELRLPQTVQVNRGWRPDSRISSGHLAASIWTLCEHR